MPATVWRLTSRAPILLLMVKKIPSGPTHLTVRMRRRLLALAVLLVALYVLVPQVGSLSSSWHVLRQARLGYVALGLGAMAATYLVAATTYTFLAKRPLRFGWTLAVQVSGSFINRLLPAGIGGMSLNAQYLRTHRHTFNEALAVVGTNNLMGVVGNDLLICSSIAFGGLSWRHVHLPSLSIPWYVAVFAGGALLLNLLVFRHLRMALANGIAGVAHTLAGYRHRPWRLIGALVSSMTLTLLHVVILWCAGQAVDLSLPLAAYVLVFSIGALTGAATPTPGGLVGVEAGLTAGLVAYGVEPGQALATALLSRLLTYWLPLLPGSITYLLVRKSLRI